jgi:hypothetical protein
MKTTIRLVACGIILLAFATQQLPLAQQPTSSPAPQASPGPHRAWRNLCAECGSLSQHLPAFAGSHDFDSQRDDHDGRRPTIANGSVLLRDGKIAAVGTNRDRAADALVIDGTGKYVTPGLIDVHSHIGDYPAPGVDANSDGNEATNPVTANVWAEHSVWPQDPQIPRALAGGLTTMQVLPAQRT